MSVPGKTNNPNGRPKGCLNKKTREAIELFDEHEFCPLEKILERLKKYGETMDEELYISTCLKLMKFKFSERKSIEISSEDERGAIVFNLAYPEK